MSENIQSCAKDIQYVGIKNSETVIKPDNGSFDNCAIFLTNKS